MVNKNILSISLLLTATNLFASVPFTNADSALTIQSPSIKEKSAKLLSCNQLLDKYPAVYCHDTVKMARNLFTAPKTWMGTAYDITTGHSEYKHIIIDVAPQTNLAEPSNCYMNGTFLGYAIPGSHLQLYILHENDSTPIAFSDPIPLTEGKHQREFTYNHIFRDKDGNYSKDSSSKTLEYDISVTIKKTKERLWTSRTHFFNSRPNQDVFRVDFKVTSRQFGERKFCEWY